MSKFTAKKEGTKISEVWKMALDQEIANSKEYFKIAEAAEEETAEDSEMEDKGQPIRVLRTNNATTEIEPCADE